MTLDELSAMNETNLFSLMSNEVVEAGLRVQAAVKLYERGSRFTTFSEFEIYRPQVLDFLLKQHVEKSVSYMPSPVADQLGRLHQKSEAIKTDLSSTSQSLSADTSSLRSEFENHTESFADHAVSVLMDLNNHSKKHETLEEKVDRGFEATDAVLDLHEEGFKDHKSETKAVLEEHSGLFRVQNIRIGSTQSDLKLTDELAHDIGYKLFWTQVTVGVLFLADLLYHIFHGAH
jgi:hypothetical protein